MTRTLPWLAKRSAATSQRPAPVAVAPQTQRLITRRPSPVGDATAATVTTSSPLTRDSTSPPSESSMEEGLGHDDRFRMVEDEFLDMARHFTRHLHAAEYQRMRKAARSPNAATIGAISRPIITKMPGDTRRAAEGAKRSKKQAKVIRKRLGEQISGSVSDDNSDNAANPWVGTSLHCLMESPRRPTASLSKISKANRTTKAAAGFREPRHRRTSQKSQPNSPPSTDLIQRTETPGSQAKHSSPSSDDGDNLNAPIRPPNPAWAKSHDIQAPAQQAEISQSKSVSSSLTSNLHKAVGMNNVQNVAPERKFGTERSRLSRPPKTAKEPPKREPDTIIPTFL